ncbi:hypothetical protein D3C79_899470 [compost metagenome]
MLNYLPAEQQLLQFLFCRLAVSHNLELIRIYGVHIALLYNHTAFNRGHNKAALARRCST